MSDAAAAVVGVDGAVGAADATPFFPHQRLHQGKKERGSGVPRGVAVVKALRIRKCCYDWGINFGSIDPRWVRDALPFVGIVCVCVPECAALAKPPYCRTG